MSEFKEVREDLDTMKCKECPNPKTKGCNGLCSYCYWDKP